MPKIANLQLSSTFITTKKVPKNNQFSPKSKAIGLPFYPKIVHFQLSSTATTNQKVPKNSHFSPKSKAIGLPFYPKIVHFQLSSTATTNQKVPKNSHFSPKSKVRYRLAILPKNRPFSTFFNCHHKPKSAQKQPFFTKK